MVGPDGVSGGNNRQLDQQAMTIGLAARPYPQRRRMQAALEATRGVDAGAIARASERDRIADAVKQARLAAVTAAIGGDWPG